VGRPIGFFFASFYFGAGDQRKRKQNVGSRNRKPVILSFSVEFFNTKQQNVNYLSIKNQKNKKKSRD